jgi:replicative DNA helicase
LFPSRRKGFDLRDNIYIKHVGSIDQLFHSMIKQVPPLVQQRNVRLVIVDSIAALLRYEYGTGTSQMVERSRVLFSQANQLKQIADQLQVVVVVINQVSDYIDDSRLVLSDFASHKKRVVPALGLAWSNCVNSRLLLSKTRSTYRGAVSSSTVPSVSDDGTTTDDANLKSRMCCLTLIDVLPCRRGWG